MLAFATSVLQPYPLIWSGDPALAQPVVPPECVPLPDETPEAFAARAAARAKEVGEAREAFDLAYVRAVETGQWDAIKRPGALPTVFWCRPVPGPLWRAYMDFVGNDEHGIGGWQRPALAFRLAVVRIDNFGTGQKVEHVEHVDKDGNRTGLGRVLSDDVVAALDSVDPMIVTVLGYAVIKSRSGPHPL